MFQSSGPELGVVVLSYRNEATIVPAVASLLEQDVAVEVVVSHSGGGSTPGILERFGSRVRLDAQEERRDPGAARNAGVAAVRAPFIAFLAADCLAAPGWAAGRLALHLRGAAAVASAVSPVDPSLASLASHVLQHSDRMPGVEAPPESRLGVSYARQVLEEHGPFPELDFCEDHLLNARLLAAGIEIVIAPDVVTLHEYPRSFGALLRDQHRRGRMVGGLPARRAAVRARVAGLALAEGPPAVARAMRGGSTIRRRRLLSALPLLALGSGAKVLGAARGGPTTPAASAQLWFRRWAREAGARRGARAPVDLRPAPHPHPAVAEEPS